MLGPLTGGVLANSRPERASGRLQSLELKTQPLTHVDVQDEFGGESLRQTGHRGLPFVQEGSETRQHLPTQKGPAWASSQDRAWPAGR